MTDQSAIYAERSRRIGDTIALKETDRVPFNFVTRFWSARLAGITCQEQMYDAEKGAAAHKSAAVMLQPDAVSCSLYNYGPTLEALDYLPLKWPGHGAGANVTFQYLDREFVAASEYDEYVADPTLFYLTKYLPRVSPACSGLASFPNLPSFSQWRLISGMRAFANPKLRESLLHLIEIGERAETAASQSGEFIKDIVALGFPFIGGIICIAPFDHIANFLRGSKGAMLDMFRHGEKLLAAMETAGRLLVRGAIEEARARQRAHVLIPLHWGLDGFMSPTQFKTFYWPPLRKMLLELIEHGLIPTVLWEGSCNSRLELIGDIPAGKAVYWFERTDMFKAKEVLGKVVCLRGNVPSALLNTGTPDDVDAYCRELIRSAGKGGGLILDGAAGIPDEAKIENVKAMAQSVHRYAN